MPTTAHSVTQFNRLTYSLSTFVISLIVTLVCIVITYQTQRTSTYNNIANLAERQVESLRVFIENDIAYIGSGANFFHASKKEDWKQFDLFAEHTIAGSNSLVGLQWMEKVESENIESHTAELQRRFPDFELYTVPKDGPVTKGYILGDKAAFIASDIYPKTPDNLGLLGFYSSRERFDLVIENILETREANLSDKVRLLQDGHDKDTEKSGMLVYHPVFDAANEHLLGVVIGVVRTTYYFENLIAKTAGEQALLVRVTDLGFDAEDDPVFFQSEGFDDAEGMKITRTIELPNRSWHVDFKVIKPLTMSNKFVLLRVALGGLTISLMLSYIVNLQTREKERLAQMLDERTEELRFLVEHDSLTELYNRRAFNIQLPQWVKGKMSFSLVGFDIDKFKAINDQYGHPVGDDMLKHVSQLVLGQLRTGDKLFRLGGDEFCILTTISQEKQLDEYLNTIGRLVARSPLQYEDQFLYCSLSLGGSVYRGESSESLLKKVDGLLYQSKMNGRNRVSIGA
ncbi:sensor domain-containing diguanylate cyclase [Vibrio sp. T187]|uniref:sensor domain-containing diguanylate cyclase n=1 Tax=Vibrio TaxID=662 RepID=UPI0010C9AF28|nr:MULTISPECIES: sensor domain-containing diguanylate cyclase [Vibrio]MBW3694854.1 sensor domain-containing diguanylate cyclase [Vibrio sp. T187]